jgi:hypothetical protein
VAVIVTGLASAVIVAGASPALASPTHVGGHHHPVKHRHHHPVKRHHHPKKHRHPKPHLKPVTVDGLVTSVHHRHVTVFASTSTIGRKTTHNTAVDVELGKHARRSAGVRKGYVVHLVAVGHGTPSHIVIPRVRSEHTTASPATVFFGIVRKASSGSLVVAQLGRIDGGHSRGGQRHSLTVDTSGATVSVDGAPGTAKAGEFVAVLGEAQSNNVVAAKVFVLSGEAEALVGAVKSVSGDAVTVHSFGFDSTVALGSDNDAPLFIDGAVASTDQLVAHDRIVVLGVVSQEEEGFQPVMAFGFDGHDHAPCGDNPAPRHHRHDG